MAIHGLITSVERAAPQMIEETEPVVDLRAAAKSLREKFEAKAAESVNNFDATSIAKEITMTLDRQKMAVIAAVLGIDKHWSNWEVNRTNGHKPPIDAFIMEHCTEILQEWVAEAVKELTSEKKAALKKQFKKCLVEDLQRRIGDSTYNAAKDLSVKFIEDLKKEVTEEILAEVKK